MSPNLDGQLIILATVFTFYVILQGVTSVARLFVDLLSYFRARAAAKELLDSLMNAPRKED
jgi:hypothetical protein